MLGPLERACLYSMLEHGHRVTLFCHKKVERIPEGVEVRDAREVTGDRPVVMHLRNVNKPNRYPSPTLFADLFRYHMIKQLGMVWLDLDCFMLQPLMVPKEGYLFVRFPKEFAWGNQINNAILALPQSSPTLNHLTEFCEDEYPIPPFYPLRWKAKLHFMSAIGKPVHVSYQKWGVWGPHALSYFVRKNGKEDYAVNSQLFYPISMEDIEGFKRGKHPFFLPSDQVKELYLKDAISVNLDGAEMNRRLGELDKTKIPKGSYLDEILKIGR